MNYYNIHYTGDEINALLGKINMENYLEIIRDSYVVYEDSFKLLDNDGVKNAIYNYITVDFKEDFQLKDGKIFGYTDINPNLARILNIGRGLAENNNDRIEVVCFGINDQVMFVFNISADGFEVVLKDMKQIITLNGNFLDVIVNVEEFASKKYVQEELKKIGGVDPEELAVIDAKLALKADKSEIPSIEGLATENFVRNAIAEAELGGGDQEIDLSGLATKDELANKVDKVEGKSLVDDAEIARLANVDNYDDSLLRDLISEKADKTDFHVHENKALLDTINDAKIIEWDNKFDMPADGLKFSHLGNDIKDEMAKIFPFSDIVDPLSGKVRDELLPEREGSISGDYVSKEDYEDFINNEWGIHRDDNDAHVLSGERDIWNAKYNKPDDGIPEEDLHQAVRDKINNAVQGIHIFGDDNLIRPELYKVPDLSNLATKDDLDQFKNYDDAELRGLIDNKVDKVEGKSLVDDAEIARLANVDNYDDTELREMIDGKAGKDELFSKDYNDLVNKPEIPSIDGLASEDFVNQKIAEAQLGGGENGEGIDLSGFATKEDLDAKVDKVEGKSLVADEEIARLANVDNYDDSELRVLIDEEKPYLTDVAAYPTSKFLFACGQPMTVEPNIGHKYDAEKPEDAVAFVYRWAEGFEAIVVEKEEAAKVYLVGGFGDRNIGARRSIPQTNMIVRDVKIKGLVGGCYFEGMVGHVNMEAENCEFVSVMGAGWCGASVNGKATRMNVVDDINIKMTNCKISSTFFGGSQGNGVADDVYAEFNNCEIGWVTAGGSNGMTRNAEIVLNGGSVKVAQSTNRGVVFKARFVLNDGIVQNLYFGGETEDATVNGIIEDGFVELNGGTVNNFKFGTDNGVEMIAEDVKGSIMDCVVNNGDISMLEKVERPVDEDLAYDDSELREMIADKADKSEIPSVEGLASEEFVNQQIAAIEHPQVDISGKVDKVENKSLVDDAEIERLAGVFNANYQFKINMIAAGEAASVSMQGDYPNITVVFNIPAGSVVEGGGEGEEEEPGTPKMWYGWIPYDESGVAGFSEVDHINENMTYDIMKFGIDNGTLIEAEPGVLGATEFLVGANGFLCTILPLDSNLIGLIDDGIGNAGTFSDFDTVSGLSLDDRTLVNKINGVTYKLSGMYDTNGGARYTIYVQEK